MLDLLLNNNHDLHISSQGDIVLTNSIVQSAVVRLKWILAEYRLLPDLGMPYFQDILVKNPNMNRIKFLIRKELMSIDGVTNVADIKITLNSKREAAITFKIQTDGQTYEKEVIIHA